jgi:hypothetical protein
VEFAMTGFRPVLIHSSLRAEAQRNKRRDSLFNGAMDHGFHYQGLKQAELWLDVHRRHAPLFADASFSDIFRHLAADTAADLAGKPVHVIGLGPGGGEKEAWVLEALHQAGCALRYTPIDASLELAILSAEVAAPYVSGEVLPVAGDLSLLAEWPVRLAQYPADEIRVYTAFGLTPNFLPSQIFGYLSGLLHERGDSHLGPKHRHSGLDAGIQAKEGNWPDPQALNSAEIVVRSLPSVDAGFRHPCRNDEWRWIMADENGRRERDMLLVSANLAPVEDDSEAAYHRGCGEILPQYDNPETRAWLRQILLDWNLAQNLSEPRFQIMAFETLLGFAAHCEWLTDLAFSWEGEPFQARAGETLRLFFSLRYTEPHLAQMLKRYGLGLGPGHVTPCGQEGVWRVARIGSN